jgi:hypothetical protein
VGGAADKAACTVRTTNIISHDSTLQLAVSVHMLVMPLLCSVCVFVCLLAAR